MIDSLTPSQQRVAVLLSRGLAVKEIAHELNLSVKTVEAHKFNLYQRLNIHKVATLTRLVVEWEQKPKAA